MLTLIVPGTEVYNEETSEFGSEGDVVLELEHSLASLSKWESNYERPFLADDEKSEGEILGYIKAMVLTPNVAAETYENLTRENFEEINKYIEAKQTATTIYEPPGTSSSRETITAELIYYWMTVFHIPFECENWNLNRLFMLIRICSIKQSPPKKESATTRAARQREMNERRRQSMNSTG